MESSQSDGAAQGERSSTENEKPMGSYKENIHEQHLQDGKEKAFPSISNVYLPNMKEFRGIKELATILQQCDNPVEASAILQELLKLEIDEATQESMLLGADALAKGVVKWLESDIPFEYQTQAIRVMYKISDVVKDCSKAFVNEGAVECLLILCDSHESLDNIFKVLSLLAFRSSTSRDVILKQGGIQKVLEAAMKNKCSVFRAIKTIGKLLGRRPAPSIQLPIEALRYVASVLDATPSSEHKLLEAVLRTLEISCILPGGIQALIALKLGTKAISLIVDPNISQAATTLLLHLMGWIGEDPCFENYEDVKSRLLPQLFTLARHNDRPLARLAIEVVSNICCGPPQMAQFVFSNKPFLFGMADMLSDIMSVEARRAACLYRNIVTVVDSKEILKHVEETNLISNASKLLYSSRVSSLQIGLKLLRNILVVALEQEEESQIQKTVAAEMNMANVRSLLKRLAEKQDSDVQYRALSVLAKLLLLNRFSGWP